MRKGFSITQEEFYLDGIVYSTNTDFMKNLKLNKLVDHIESKVNAGESKIVKAGVEYLIKQLFYELEVVGNSAIVKLSVDVFDNEDIIEKIIEKAEACTSDKIIEKMIEMYEKMI